MRSLIEVLFRIHNGPPVTLVSQETKTWASKKKKKKRSSINTIRRLWCVYCPNAFRIGLKIPILIMGWSWGHGVKETTQMRMGGLVLFIKMKEGGSDSAQTEWWWPVRYIWETTADPDIYMKQFEEASIETFCRLQSRNNQLIIEALIFMCVSVSDDYCIHHIPGKGPNLIQSLLFRVTQLANHSYLSLGCFCSYHGNRAPVAWQTLLMSSISLMVRNTEWKEMFSSHTVFTFKVPMFQTCNFMQFLNLELQSNIKWSHWQLQYKH